MRTLTTEYIIELTKIPNTSIDFICAELPEIGDMTLDLNIKIYKDLLFWLLCEYQRVLKSHWNIVLFFDKKTISWIGKELKKFPLLKYKGPIFIQNYHNNMKNNIVQNNYDVCFWLTGNNDSHLDKTKLKRHLMYLESNEKQAIVEELIMNFTRLGDLVLNWISWLHEIETFCDKKLRDCISI